MGYKTLTRLIFAACISLTCFGATYFWYHSTDPNAQRGNGQKPIAYAERTQDEIHRRPVTRLIWQLVTDGEPLYPGEAIRTSPIGEVRIQFADSEKYIELEPDSLIVISQSKNEISLDLMDGSFMVAQTGESKVDAKGPSLTLNSSNGKVDLSKATASLSKSTTGNIDLQVLKGKATIENNGESREIKSGKLGAVGAAATTFNQDNLKILTPSLENPSYINPEAIQPIQFQWKGFPTGAIVSLHAGFSRKEMKKVGETTTESLLLRFKAGKHYWKLTAVDKNSNKPIGESPLYRLEVTPRFAPAMISPDANAFIPKITDQEVVAFQWSGPEDILKVSLEVAKDPALVTKVINKAFNKETSYSQILPTGDYYWRLNATYLGLNSIISSKVQKFSVGAMKPKVVIGWQNPDDKKPQYFVDKPTATLGWLSEQKNQVKFWRLRLADKEGDVESPSAQIFETKELNFQTKMSKPGRYIAMVEAVDEADRVIANSPMKVLELAPLPLLPAPKISPETGDLIANNEGKLDLQWNVINGAKEYEITLYDANGKELTKRKARQNSTGFPTIPILFPGKYKVRVMAIDQHGRQSEVAESRAIQVPEGSGLNAPKLKKIKVN